MRCLEKGLDRGRRKERDLAADATKQVLEKGGQLLARERRHRVTHHRALVERLVHGHGDAAAQLALPAENEAEAVVGVHRVVGEEAQLFEHIAAQVMGLVDDEHRPEARFGAQARDLGANLAVERSAVALDGETKLPGDALVHVHRVARGQRDVGDLVESPVKLRAEAAASGRLAAAAVARDEADAAQLDQVGEPDMRFGDARRHKQLVRQDAVGEGIAGHAKVFGVHQRSSVSSLRLRRSRSRRAAGGLGDRAASIRGPLPRRTKQLA